VLILSVVMATLAVARLTRLLTEDQLTVKYRQWVVRRWGEDSLLSYFAHCQWCTSFWIALVVMPPAVLFPNKWVIAALAPWAASMVTGVLSERKG
jgi:hypothetical protein